jgi:predicted DNA-binding mobile mystery protein A
MNAKQLKLARQQLDTTLMRFKSITELAPPLKGWVRAIRDALGMTGKQLAKRINVNQQRVARIEQDEKLGRVKINTLRNVAEALDCTFVYGFVPKDSLEQTVKKRAAEVATKRMRRSDQTMRLEKQELSRKDKQDAFDSLVKEIVDTMPKSLWDEQW